MVHRLARLDRRARAVSRRTAGTWLGVGLFASLIGLAAPSDTDAAPGETSATCTP